jgi:RNA polymerase sigma-70 factor (sigma-E family)
VPLRSSATLGWNLTRPRGVKTRCETHITVLWANAVTPRRSDEAFCRFAQEFSPALLRAAYLMLGDRAAAEDAVQSTLLRTYRRWSRARASPAAYSRRALVNICHDHRRHDRRHPQAQLPAEGPPLPAGSEAKPDAIEERDALARALAELTSRQRAVVVLRFYLDQSVGETAELLGIPEGTVKSSASRALAHLRDQMSVATNGVPNAQ